MRLMTLIKLVHVCYYSFCFEILMIHGFFFQMYKYVLKDILLFMSYLISLHMKKNVSFQFLIFINNTYFTQINVLIEISLIHVCIFIF
jgi:hypothetical protein